MGDGLVGPGRGRSAWGGVRRVCAGWGFTVDATGEKEI